MLPNYFQNAKAVIFDCDGVLVDSEKISCFALNIIFEKYFDIDIGQDYQPIIGKALNEAIQYYLKKYNITNYNLKELMQAKEAAYKESAKSKLNVFPLTVQTLQKIKQTNRKLAIASSGSMDKIKFSTTTVNIYNLFDVITSAEEVSKGKPAPDVYKLTLERLCLKPEECVVIEDSINGAIAAQQAKIPVYGFSGTFSQEDFYKIKVPYLEDRYSTINDLLDQ
jgi:HAD superfamily hydrolase (TIGR01509 family)